LLVYGEIIAKTIHFLQTILFGFLGNRIPENENHYCNNTGNVTGYLKKWIVLHPNDLPPRWKPKKGKLDFLMKNGIDLICIQSGHSRTAKELLLSLKQASQSCPSCNQWRARYENNP